ncbi:glyoxylase I 4-like [Diospyros lotus]|uniref:glyoxylase I 4-like n=1 Tax=Diospyros lotus TaxID=55363 RepID=UPI002251418D|nr:glyoxylase I 4-like [Diospyros lotus]
MTDLQETSTDQLEEEAPPLSLKLNHVSLVCKSSEDSARFYEKVLGFGRIKRPDFDIKGAWLYNYGIGIHLLEAKQNMIELLPPKKDEINPEDNHISFETEDVGRIIDKLKAMSIKYEQRTVPFKGEVVDQLFFHDPDGYMIEICNCYKFKTEPIGARRLLMASASLTPSTDIHVPCSCCAFLLMKNEPDDMVRSAQA